MISNQRMHHLCIKKFCPPPRFLLSMPFLSSAISYTCKDQRLRLDWKLTHFTCTNLEIFEQQIDPSLKQRLIVTQNTAKAGDDNTSCISKVNIAYHLILKRTSNQLYCTLQST